MQSRVARWTASPALILGLGAGAALLGFGIQQQAHTDNRGDIRISIGPAPQELFVVVQPQLWAKACFLWHKGQVDALPEIVAFADGEEQTSRCYKEV